MVPAEPVINDRQLESTFQMLYYGEFLAKDKPIGELAQKLFTSRYPPLCLLLADYKKPSDYETLKSAVYSLITSLPEY